MCKGLQGNDTSSPLNNAAVGRITFSPLSESERRAEIDMRVGARLAEREVYRQRYVNGFLDCFYVLAAIAWVVYIAWFWNKES